MPRQDGFLEKLPREVPPAPDNATPQEYAQALQFWYTQFLQSLANSEIRSGAGSADWDDLSGELYRIGFKDGKIAVAFGDFDAGGDHFLFKDGAGEFTGPLVAGALHVPDEDDTADSFHVDTDGDTWWGATSTDFAADPTNAAAYVQKDGTARFASVTVVGGVIDATSTVAGTAASSVEEGSARGNAGLDGSGLVSQTVPDARVAQTSVTQHEGAVNALNLTNAPAEALADVTGSNTAAAISGQGNLATLNEDQVIYRQAADPGHQSGRVWIDTNNGDIKRSNGSTWTVVGSVDALRLNNAPAEASADVTANNTANDSNALGGQAGSFYRDAGNLNAGTLADARVASGNVTQHEGSITISNLTGTAADAQVVSSNVTQHEGSVNALNLTNAPNEAGADVTGNNTANDTSNVNSVAASDVTDQAATGGQNLLSGGNGRTEVTQASAGTAAFPDRALR